MKNKTYLVFIKELKTILKDKKTLIIMLASPLIIPFIVMFYAIFNNYMQGEEKTYTVGLNYELTEAEIEIFDTLKIEKVLYESKDELDKGYKNGEYSTYIIKENDKYTVYTNSSTTSGSMVLSLVNAYFDSYNKYLGNNYLVGEDIDIALVYNNLDYEFVELEKSDLMATLMYVAATSYIVMIIVSTASTIANDTISGEKERGTLETLLTFPVRKNNIIAGKYLSIFIACLINVIVSLILTFSSFYIVKLLYNINFGNISIINVLLTTITCVLCAIIVSGLCIGIAAKCKTFKETQQALSYVTTITILPMFLEMFEIKSNIITSMIPIIGNSMLLNDIIYGKIDYLNIVVMIVSNIIISIVIIKFVAKMYNSEKVLFS